MVAGKKGDFRAQVHQVINVAAAAVALVLRRPSRSPRLVPLPARSPRPRNRPATSSPAPSSATRRPPCSAERQPVQRLRRRTRPVVQFWGGGNVYVLGVSDSTTTQPVQPGGGRVQQLHARPGVRDRGTNPCEARRPRGPAVRSATRSAIPCRKRSSTTPGNGDLTFTVN